MKQSEAKRGQQRAFYKTPEDLQAAVDRYFAKCQCIPLFDRDGMPIVNSTGNQKYKWEPAPPSMSGLSLFLGFKDRRLFTRQKYRGAAFRDVVLLARLRVEACAEMALYDRDSYRGAAFLLSTAFGWKEDLEQDEKPAAVTVINRARGYTGTGGDPGAMRELGTDLLN